MLRIVAALNIFGFSVHLYFRTVEGWHWWATLVGLMINVWILTEKRAATK